MEQVVSERDFLFLGVGGCGCSIVDFLASQLPLKNSFVAINNSDQSSKKLLNISNHISVKNQRVTEGDWEWLKQKIKDAKGVCILVGLGGQTGGLLAPLVLNQAKKMNKTVIVIATMPFDFEKRMDMAQQALQSLSSADYLVTFPNQELVNLAKPNVSMKDTFRYLDEQILSLFQ